MSKQAIRKTSAVFCLKVASHFILLLASILLANLLGVAGYGVYAYAISWTNLLSIPATLGLDRLLVREIAIYQTQGNWALMRGILRWANRTVGLVSVGIALTAGLILYTVNILTHSHHPLAFYIALTAVPMASFRSLRLATLRGLHKIVIGLLPEILLMPTLMIVLSIATHWLLPERLTAAFTVSLYLLSTIITFGIGTTLLSLSLPPETKDTLPQYRTKEWLRSALPLMVLGGMVIINHRADILMLGAIKGVEAAGVYRACIRGAQLITFTLIAVNATLAPTVASLYAQQKIEELQKIITQCSCIISSIAFLTTIILIVTSGWYLALFGPEFAKGQTALIFLCIGSFFNAATGSVGVLLNMTGHEKYTAISVTASAILNVLGNTLLIPNFGIEGAAFSTSSSIVFVNIAKVVWVRRKLGIDATALSRFSSLR